MSNDPNQSQNPYVHDNQNPYDQPVGNQYANYAPQPPYGYAPVLPEHPQATTVLVLGIVAMVVGGITGPFAWVMGSKARKEIAANPGRYREGGTLTIGWVLGIVGTAYLALMVVILIFYVIMMIFIFSQVGMHS